jgi:phage tail sheath gpL-like
MPRPNITSSIKSAKTPITPAGREILIVAPMVSGTATSGALVENILSELEFNTYFGRTSKIAKIGRQMIKASNISSVKPKISAIGLSDNGSGVAATGSFAISGTATASGTLTFYVDSIRGKYQVAVASGDTANTIGTALATLINADLDKVVSASNSTGTVTLTAINKGSVGNSIGIMIEGSVAGITISLTAFSSGATDPSLTGLFDVIDSKRFSTILYPSEWTLSTLTDLTEARFSVNNKILFGQGVTSKTATYSTLNSAGDGLNIKTFNYLGNNLVNKSTKKGGAIFEDPMVIAGYFAIYRELRLTQGSNVSAISINGVSNGGLEWASYPYHNTPYPLLPVIPTGEGFTDAEAQELENSGITLLVNNIANNVIIGESAVTTYKTNAQGLTDKTFKYLNTIDTLTLIVEYFFVNFKRDYGQHSLTTGTLIAGKAQVNKELFINTAVRYYNALAKENLLINSAEAVKSFREELELSTIINLADGKIVSEAIAPITSQLREIFINYTPTFE